MKKYTLILISFLCCLGCKKESTFNHTTQAKSQKKDKRTSDDIMSTLLNPNDKDVIVIAHRGDWRHAPENSIQAIENCIDMGVDVVEIDINESKDGVLVIMHDKTIDRTTTGKGNVQEWTVDSLKQLQLRNGAAYVTDHKMPTLEEVLLAAKGRIAIDLDIKPWVPFEKVYQVLKKTGTVNQVFTGSYRPLEEARAYYGPYLDSIHYFPGMHDEMQNISQYIKEFETTIDPPVFVPKFKTDTSFLVAYLDTLVNLNNKIWMHSITASRTGGHHDDLALVDPDGAYGWLLNKGVSVIQTDRPALLLDYLRKKGLHH